MVPSTARQSQNAGFGINRDADPASQLFTLMARTAMEDRLFRQGGKIISDRTPLDSLAYTRYQMERVWDQNLWFYWEMCWEHTYTHMQRYDAIYYFPIYWPPKKDKARDPDPQYQKDIDQNVRDLLVEMHIKTVRVPNMSIQDRAKFVKQTLTTPNGDGIL